MYVIMRCSEGSVRLLLLEVGAQADPSQHTRLGHYQASSEMPFEWRFAGGHNVAANDQLGTKIKHVRNGTFDLAFCLKF